MDENLTTAGIATLAILVTAIALMAVISAGIGYLVALMFVEFGVIAEMSTVTWLGTSALVFLLWILFS